MCYMYTRHVYFLLSCISPVMCYVDSVPVCTFFEGLGPGCVAVALSHDAMYLATLSQSPHVQV